jgi:hypothetical protein
VRTWEAFAAAYRNVATSHEPMKGGGMMGGEGKGRMAANPFPDRMAMHTKMMGRHLAGPWDWACLPRMRAFLAARCIWS